MIPTFYLLFVTICFAFFVNICYFQRTLYAPSKREKKVPVSFEYDVLSQMRDGTREAKLVARLLIKANCLGSNPDFPQIFFIVNLTKDRLSEEKMEKKDLCSKM